MGAKQSRRRLEDEERDQMDESCDEIHLDGSGTDRSGSATASLISFSDSDAAVEALKDACKTGNVKQVESLIRSGINVNHKYVIGLTPLHFAAIHGQIAVAKLLRGAGADPMAETTDEDRLSPLRIAESEMNQELFDAVADDPPAKYQFQRRLIGPFIMTLFLLSNIAFWFFLILQYDAFDGATWCFPWSLVFAILFWVNLILVNLLDPGTVEDEDVEYIADLRALSKDEIEVFPVKNVTENERFTLHETGETFIWCRNCKFWKPQGISHCFECRRCFTRMDHHCFAVGNCIAVRNHRFFVIMMLSGMTAWTVAVISIFLELLPYNTSEDWWPVGANEVQLYLAAGWVATSSITILGVVLPFACFHTSALICNFTTKTCFGKRGLGKNGLQINDFTQMKEVHCMALQCRDPPDTCSESGGGSIRDLTMPEGRVP